MQGTQFSRLKSSKQRHGVSLFIDTNTATYFDYFGIKYIPQEVIKYLINHNILRIQDIESIICGFYCIIFIEHVFTGKT